MEIFTKISKGKLIGMKKTAKFEEVARHHGLRFDLAGSILKICGTSKLLSFSLFKA